MLRVNVRRLFTVVLTFSVYYSQPGTDVFKRYQVVFHKRSNSLDQMFSRKSGRPDTEISEGKLFFIIIF